jgi:hypothetical protein
MFDYEIADFGCSGVNDTAGDKNDTLYNPYIFCVIVLAIGYFNLPT